MDNTTLGARRRTRRRLGAAPILLGKHTKRHCTKMKRGKGGRMVCAKFAPGKALGRRSKRRR